MKQTFNNQQQRQQAKDQQMLQQAQMNQGVVKRPGFKYSATSTPHGQMMLPQQQYGEHVNESASYGNLNHSNQTQLQEQQSVMRRSTQIKQAQRSHYYSNVQNTSKSNGSGQGQRALSGHGSTKQSMKLQMSMVSQNSGNKLQGGALPGNFPASPQAQKTPGLQMGGAEAATVHQSMMNTHNKQAPQNAKQRASVGKRTSLKLVTQGSAHTTEDVPLKFYTAGGQPGAQFKQYQDFASIGSQERVAQEVVQQHPQYATGMQYNATAVRKSGSGTGAGTAMRKPSAKHSHHPTSGSADYQRQMEAAVNSKHLAIDDTHRQQIKMSKNLHKGQIPPHFIKVKSKTNVNPTRQNSPGLSKGTVHDGKLEVQYTSSIGSRPSLLSNTNFSNQKRNEQHIELEGEPTVGRGQHQNQKQVVTRRSAKQMVLPPQQIFSQPNSPSKGDGAGLMAQNRPVGIGEDMHGSAVQAGYQMIQTQPSSTAGKAKNLSLSGTNALKQSTDLRVMNMQQKRLNSDVTSAHGMKDQGSVQQYHSPPAQSTNLSQIGQISLLTENPGAQPTLYQTQNWQKKYLNLGTTKAGAIHMRKVHPVSKTAQTASKNTSIDRKNNLASFHEASNLSHGNGSNAQMTAPQSHASYVQPPQIMPGGQQKKTASMSGAHQGNAGAAIMPNSSNKQSFQKLSEQRFISHKNPKSFTTKVSLNNTPRGSKKINFGYNMPDQNLSVREQHQIHQLPVQGFAGDATVQSMKSSTIKSTKNSNQKAQSNSVIQKPQQQMRQQQQPPIIQPQGDIPLLPSSNKNNLAPTYLSSIQNPAPVQVTAESSTSKSYGNKASKFENLEQNEMADKKYNQSVLVSQNSKRGFNQTGRPNQQIVGQGHAQKKSNSKSIIGSIQATTLPGANFQTQKNAQAQHKLKMRLIMDHSPPVELAAYASDQIINLSKTDHMSKTPGLISPPDAVGTSTMGHMRETDSQPGALAGGASCESGGMIPQERARESNNIAQNYNNMLAFAGMSGSQAHIRQTQADNIQRRMQRNSAGQSNSGTFNKGNQPGHQQPSKMNQMVPASSVNRQGKRAEANLNRRQSAAPSSSHGNTGRGSAKTGGVTPVNKKSANTSVQRSQGQGEGNKAQGKHGLRMPINSELTSKVMMQQAASGDHEMSQQYMNQYFKQKKNINQIVPSSGHHAAAKSSSQDPGHLELKQHMTVVGVGGKPKVVRRSDVGKEQGLAFAHLRQVGSPKDSSIERARQNDMIFQEAQANLKHVGANKSHNQQQQQQMQHYQTVGGPIKAGLPVVSNANIELSQLGQFSATQGFNQHKTHDDVRQMIQKNKTSSSVIDEKTRQKQNSSAAKKTSQSMSHHYILDNIEHNDGKPDHLSPRSKEVYLIRQLILDCFRKYKKPPKTQLELYKIGKMLGKGAFGKVNLGLHRLTRKLCAIKSINMDFMKEESQKKKIMNEIGILKALRHPNNIKILETFQTDKHHMIVMELCPGGDLLNYVRKRRKLGEKYAKFVFRQIMEGIAYLHENGVSHRDIKLDNILLDGHGNIKIGDFGVSKKIEENEILFEQCGTPAYIAPEIVKDMGYKGFPVDIWSAGICLYAMLYGNVPFKANQIGDLNTVEQLNQDIEYKDTVSKEAIDLMKAMLTKAPKLRSTAQDALRHPWLQDEVDEHIDIFDEQELELIRKEFTYVLQKKKLKEFKDARTQLLEAVSAKLGGGPIMQQASRRPDDLNTEFTECSIQTHENTLMKNDSSRSVILCPFNTQTGEKTAIRIMKQAEGLMCDKDLMIRFHPRVRELDRNYEKLNNQDFDNGVYHKYAYKQKGKKGEKNEEQPGKTHNSPARRDDGPAEESIRHSDVQVNNLVPARTGDERPKRRREPVDVNYHNYYIKLNQSIIDDTSRLGFPLEYIQKCLKDNATNHCTTTYYLLCMDQNF